MIVVKAELWKYGSDKNTKSLGTLVIINDGSGTMKRGNYEFFILKSDEYLLNITNEELLKNRHLINKSHIWKKGILRGFFRLKFGVWDLILMALFKLLLYKRLIK